MTSPADLITRRSLLKSVAAAGLAAPAISLLGRAAWAEDATGSDARPLKLAWNANAACLSGVATAFHNGVFKKHGLNVELVNYSGSTDQLLESIATAKTDAGVGMALRWLKPLEQGFDVKLTSGTHGGCLRLLVPKGGSIKSIADLRGKTIATPDLAGPDKNFFSVILAKHGIDPAKDVEWKQYPGNLLTLAVDKGEAHALTASDPLSWGFLKEGKVEELATNLTGEHAHRTCCVVGVRGSLLRENKETVAKLNKALLEAQDIVAASPEVGAAAYSEYAPKFSRDDVAAMLRSHTHGEHVVGDSLRSQLTQYAEELKLVSVIKPSTDTVKFAQRITYDIFG
ncbi:MAG TPA: ABC transporter substrate-binding protein [Candidatus Sulfotelmatobacter sp.]|jgi:NitT/TauT family transport system substrate-binding protein|nr:ABC transporter substrate-binding protein [Candidatus Sulfotelmatobacter sp.]